MWKRFKLNSFIGKMLFFLGFNFKASTGIHGGITYGYGKLDEYGFWHFPMYKGKLKQRNRL